MGLHDNHRILIIDDSPGIHSDFRKILNAGSTSDSELEKARAAVFGSEERSTAEVVFHIDSAYQGREGLAKVEQSIAEGRPYAMAFVDVRMPPGWDGVETITRIWAVDAALQVVICTAYSEYSWQDVTRRLGKSDQFVILKKPFDNIEAIQLAHAMCRKWTLARAAAAKLEDLDALVRERTTELCALNDKLTLEVADRETAQAALRVSEERLHKAFDACPLPTAILQVFDQRVVQANQAVLTATELSDDEIVGHTLWESVIVTTADFRRTAAASLFVGESIRRHECEFRTKSGETRRGLLWLEPFALASGPHVLAILQDVSEQHSLECQLRQAQKMEAVGQLAAGVAHDFNNLLTVIHGHSSLRLKGALDRRIADSFAAVQQASERAADLTRQLLVFSRKQVMKRQNLNLDQVATNLSAMLKRLIPENITLEFSHSPDLPQIRADRGNIEQVLMNLVVNARDALPQGGGIFVSTQAVEIDSAHVRACPEASAGKYVCLTVRDTGVGMDETTVRRIFEPFFTTKDVGKGTGMGLATVHGVVKQHDGWIEVISALGCGSEFRVYLQQAAPEADVIPLPMVLSQTEVSGRTILLAEDDPDVRMLARYVLEERGIHVHEAADGQAALALWAEHRDTIDLLLTDMVMPGGMSGADLAARIRDDRADLPVIYSSGYSVSLLRGELQIQEDVNYLPKPYLAQNLISIVTRALGQPAIAA